MHSDPNLQICGNSMTVHAFPATQVLNLVISTVHSHRLTTPQTRIKDTARQVLRSSGSLLVVVFTGGIGIKKKGNCIARKERKKEEKEEKKGGGKKKSSLLQSRERKGGGLWGGLWVGEGRGGEGGRGGLGVPSILTSFFCNWIRGARR